ncbi:hypothetical protein [Flavobacterium psychrophilum]|uniref:hypothetical protein n=1 Tax=Flavobacterium psychrophilum TaxID=96345 RepID=UPI000618795F|nr:hypothetical protein [Flavobacterium psychrophilum]OAE93993.1 hypothetical protein SU65_01410 [Flavobacterium psychrophilum]
MVRELVATNQRQPLKINPVSIKIGANGSGTGGNQSKATAPVVPVLLIEIKKVRYYLKTSQNLQISRPF